MILLSPEELAIIQQRAIDGYDPNGIFALNSNPWDDLVTRADKLIAGTVNEYWDGVYNDDEFTYDTWPTQADYSVGQHTLACATYYLVKGTTSYGEKARDTVLAQLTNTEPVWSDYYTRPTTPTAGWSNFFHMAGILLRMYFSFEYTKDLWTAQNISDFEDYMEEAMPAFLAVSEYGPAYNFPQRLNRMYPKKWPLDTYVAGTFATGDQVVYTDTHGYESLVDGNTVTPTDDGINWSRITGSGASAGSQSYGDTDARSWTHKDGEGTFQNRLYRVMEAYGNQPAICMLMYGIWAIYKGDATAIDRTKIYYEEVLRFATFPDGTLHEYIRNDVTNPSKGVAWYGMIQIECQVVFAEALRRLGDTSMYSFTTSLGIWGTEGGSKNIELMLNTLKDACTLDTIRYWDTVTDANRFDTLKPTTYRWKPEMTFAIANLYFNDANFKDTYLLNNAFYDYDYAGGPAYVTDGIWVGGSGVYSDVPTMVYEMEGVHVPTITKNGVKTMLF